MELRTLFASFCLALAAGSALSYETREMGINYSVGFSDPDKRLNDTAGIAKVIATGITRVKLFEFAGIEGILDALQAEFDKGVPVEVMVDVPNYRLKEVTEDPSGLLKIVQQYSDIITEVAVGNEPLINYNFPYLKDLLGPACRTVGKYLPPNMKMTVPFAASIMTADSYPPTAGKLNQTIFPYYEACIEEIVKRDSYFTVNLYPYISWINTKNVALDFSIFELNSGESGCFIDGPYEYCDLFSASYDTMRAALDSAGFRNLMLQVGESGWPTGGGPAGPFDREGADPASGCQYLNGQLESAYESFTPMLRKAYDNGRWPNLEKTGIPMYLFEAFDEANKDTQGGKIPYEPFWGIWGEAGEFKFPIDWTGKNGYQDICTEVAAQAVEEAIEEVIEEVIEAVSDPNVAKAATEFAEAVAETLAELEAAEDNSQ